MVLFSRQIASFVLGECVVVTYGVPFHPPSFLFSKLEAFKWQTTAWEAISLRDMQLIFL